MHGEPRAIISRSYGQVMDWSLVLASQGIETVLEFLPESNAWELRLAPEERARAEEVLRVYELENRHWRWRTRVWRGELLFDWTSVLWVILLAAFYVAASRNPAVRESGLMERLAINRGEIWRFFTAVWLHADPAHLAGNAVIGCLFLGLAMGKCGGGIALLACYLAGAMGNLAVWLLPLAQGSLGASGMVMGALGLLAGSAFLKTARGLPGRSGTADPSRHKLLSAARGCTAGALLFVLLGLNPQTDVRAHAGGFLAGVLFGWWLRSHPGWMRSRTLRFVSAGMFTVLVVCPWYFAFRSAR